MLLAGGDVGEPPGLEWTPSPACTGVTHRRAAVALSAIVTFVGVVVVLGKWVAPLIVALWTAESGG